MDIRCARGATDACEGVAQRVRATKEIHGGVTRTCLYILGNSKFKPDVKLRKKSKPNLLAFYEIKCRRNREWLTKSRWRKVCLELSGKVVKGRLRKRGIKKDVRYQEWTEVTLGCEVKDRGQGSFFFLQNCALRLTKRRFRGTIP